tara:strand:+ start:4415 stop:5560 length:1146 start_codon:yes stop_codon:yes gene_type:complete
MKLLLDGKPRNIYFRKDNTAYFKKNGIENDITDYFKKSGGLKKQYTNLLIKTNTNVAVKKKMILGGESDFSIPIVFDPIEIENKTGKKCWDIETLKTVCTKLIYIFLLAKIHFNANGGELFIKGYTEYHKIYINLLDIIVQYIFNKKSINTELNGIALLNDSTDSNDKSAYLESVKVLTTAFTNIGYEDILRKLKEVETYESKYTEEDDCDEKSEGFYVVKHHMITEGIFKPMEKDSSEILNTERYKSKSLTKDELEKIKEKLLEEIKKLSETQNTIKKEVIEYKKKIINEAKYKRKLIQHTKANNIDKIEIYNELLKPIENIKDEINTYESELKDNESELKDLKLELKDVESKLKDVESKLTSEIKADDAYRDPIAYWYA